MKKVNQLIQKFHKRIIRIILIILKKRFNKTYYYGFEHKENKA